MWENEGNKSWEHIGRGRERGTGKRPTPDARLDSLEGRHALLFKGTFLPLSFPLPFPFFLSLCSRQTFQRRWEADVELQTAGRAVTITPFTSIQTFWGTGEAEERGRESERGGGTNSLHDTGWVFRLEYTVCKTVGWVGMWRDGENLCTSARYRQKQWKENRKLKKWRSCAKGNLIPHNAGTDCEAVLGIQEYL